MKRFYKSVAHVPAENAEGFSIQLDGRPVKTPAKAPLLVPAEPLARAVAEEWAAQQEEVRPHDMPLTALASTAIDLVRPYRAQSVRDVATFGETDLICYRADHPEELVRRQQAAWQPLVDWAAVQLDAPLQVVRGVIPVVQPGHALDTLERTVDTHDDMALAALSAATRAAGSLVIGLALSLGRLNAAQAFEAAELDSTYQLEVWGEDPEATKRREGVRADLEAAERFLALLRG